MFRILAIDGGGMRGLIPATVLAELEARTKRPVAELFDLVAASSTGTLIALALLRPGRDGRPAWTAAELAGSYRTDGHRFFGRSPWRAAWTLNGMLAAKYSDGPLTRALQSWLGDTMLSRSLTPVLATSYDVLVREPYTFSSAQVASGALPDQPMWQVARCSSAGPTFFAPARVRIGGTERWLIDGAFTANNPALDALAEAHRRGVPANEIALVSLGTGRVATPYGSPLVRAGGMLGWVTGAHHRLLVDALIDGQSDAVAAQARSLVAKKRYVRFDVDLDASCEAIDDYRPANMQRLHEAAMDMLAGGGHVAKTVELLTGGGGQA